LAVDPRLPVETAAGTHPQYTPRGVTSEDLKASLVRQSRYRRKMIQTIGFDV
jgi:hypothetical protein